MKIVVFEGLDKAGKHTISEKFAKALRQQGKKVAKSEFTRYDTPTGKLLYKYLHGTCDMNNFANQLLLFSNKYEQMPSFKALEEQGYDYLVLDRYILSQGIYGQYNIEKDYKNGLITKSEKVNQLLMLDIFNNKLVLQPYVNVIIDIPVDVSMKRKGQWGKNDIYESDNNLLKEVRSKYLEYATLNPSKTLVVDGTPKVEEVLQNTLDSFKKFEEEYKIPEAVQQELPLMSVLDKVPVVKRQNRA